MKTITRYIFHRFFVIGIYLSCLGLYSSLSIALEFTNEKAITPLEEFVEFSRSTNGQLAADSQGRIHLVYSIQDTSITPAIYHIVYRSIINGVPSEPQRVDRGIVGGGRHPSLCIDKQDTVHVVWHDFRNSTAGGNGVDNLEIYYNKKPLEGNFLPEDIRLTNTHADHKADNGYLPKILFTPNGRLYVIWYDFHRNGNQGEIYLRSSDAQGNFSPQEGIDADRIADVNDAGEFSSLWTPSIAWDGTNLIAVWGFSAGYSGLYQIQTRSILLDRTLGAIEILENQGGSFYDPPRMAYDAAGNIGLVYTAPTTSQSGLIFRYKPRNQSLLPSLNIAALTGTAAQPDLAFNSQGEAFVVWQETSDTIGSVFLAEVDLNQQKVIFQQTLSSEESNAKTPALTIDPQDRIHIVWCDSRETGTSRIYYMQEVGTAVTHWKQY